MKYSTFALWARASARVVEAIGDTAGQLFGGRIGAGPTTQLTQPGVFSSDLNDQSFGGSTNQ